LIYLLFVKDVIQAARKCIKESTYYEKNKHSIITLYKEGLKPYTGGIPVIGSKYPAKRKK